MGYESMPAADPGGKCPCAPAAVVRIYQLAREFEIWFQLCPTCLAARLGAGWQRRVNRTPPFDDLHCDGPGPDARCARLTDGPARA